MDTIDGSHESQVDFEFGFHSVVETQHSLLNRLVNVRTRVHRNNQTRHDTLFDSVRKVERCNAFVDRPFNVRT